MYIGFIFLLSSQPGLQLPYKFGGADKISHVVLYTPLGSLVSYALVRSGTVTNIVFRASLFALLYGVADEFHQNWMPGRNASAFDVIADGLGGFVGSYIHIKAVRFKERE